MYSKQQASQLKQDFWTRFGQYMKPVLSASGEKVNWSNYKTGVPHLYFRLRAEKGHAMMAIEMTAENSRHTQFAQFLSLRSLLEQAFGKELRWEENTTDDFEKPVSRISLLLPEVNVFRESDWPAIISFFKTHLIALDDFWNDAKPLFY